MASKSLGEEKLIKIFKAAALNFKCEVVFNDLHGSKDTQLRFDFGIYDNNEKLISLYEFDGQHHFQQVKIFQKTRTDFLKSQERDRKKNSYCLANKIPLYRIPFWELDNLKTFKDTLQQKFLVHSKWHNDEIWRTRHQSSAK